MLDHHPDSKRSKMSKNYPDIKPRFGAKSDLTFVGVIRGPGISMHTTHIHSLSALDRVVAEGYDRQEQQISDGVSGIAGKLPY